MKRILFAFALLATATPALAEPWDHLPENTIIVARLESAEAFFAAWETLAVAIGPPANQLPLQALIGQSLANPLYSGIDMKRPVIMALTIPMRPPLAHEIRPRWDHLDAPVEVQPFEGGHRAPGAAPAPPAFAGFDAPDAGNQPAEEDLRPGEPELCLFLPLSDPDLFDEAMQGRDLHFAVKIVGNVAIIGQPAWMDTLGKYRLPAPIVPEGPIHLRIDMDQIGRIYKESLDEMRQDIEEIDEFTDPEDVFTRPFGRMFLQVATEARQADVALIVGKDGVRMRGSLAPRPGTALAHSVLGARPADPRMAARLMSGDIVMNTRMAFLRNYWEGVAADFRRTILRGDDPDPKDAHDIAAVEAIVTLIGSLDAAALSARLNSETGAIDATALFGGNGAEAHRAVAALGGALAALTAEDDEGRVIYEPGIENVAGIPVDRLRIALIDGHDEVEARTVQAIFGSGPNLELLIAARPEGLAVALGPNRAAHLAALLGGAAVDGELPRAAGELFGRPHSAAIAHNSRKQLEWMVWLMRQTDAPEQMAEAFEGVLREVPEVDYSLAAIRAEGGRLMVEQVLPLSVIKLQVQQIVRMMGGLAMMMGEMEMDMEMH